MYKYTLFQCFYTTPTRITRFQDKGFISIEIYLSHTLPQFESDIYGMVNAMGYEGVTVFTGSNATERVAIVAISQYSRLKCTSHLPINAIEVCAVDNVSYL